jgi:Fibronectin type III domain
MRARNISSNHLFAILFVSVLLASLSANQAFAMGQAPSTCNNRYDGPITSAKITVGDKTYFPMTSNVSFHLPNDKSYTISFTIHTPSQSSQGNTLPGTTWYSTSAPGYQMGTCVNGATSNQDITLTLNEGHSGSLAPDATQTVNWRTLVSGFSYVVQWTNPNATKPGIPTNLSATVLSSSEIDLSWNAPTNDGGSPITGYRIQSSTDGSTWTTIVKNTGTTGTTYSDTGLFSNTTYYYRVFALNSVGSSYRSNIASATTQ